METTTLHSAHSAASSSAAEGRVLDHKADKAVVDPARPASPAADDKDDKLPRGLRIALAIALGVLSWGVVFALVRWLAF